MNSVLVFFFCLLTIGSLEATGQEERYDICIYGGTSAGVIAAYTASKAGKRVVLIEPGNRLGGLSSGGLGQTDIGNKYVVKGLALDFYRKIGKRYGSLEQWIFEPKIADSIFRWYMSQCDATLLKQYRIQSVDKESATIRSIQVVPTMGNTHDPKTIQARVFLDCTYEGDLFAMAGASYHVGREANSIYQETLNGVQLFKGHQLPDSVDPYIVKGDPTSGLIWGVNNHVLMPNGTGDHKVQAYNYRITLTNVPSNRLPITEPDNYDPKRYELLRRQKEIDPWKSLEDVFIWSMMPNGKTDINNRNGFSTDMIGMNWEYPEASFERRKEIIKAHEDYTKGLLYFVGNDPSIPRFIREEMQKWGYPKDEYVEYGHCSPQLYIREARRLIGELVMTQHHCQGREIVRDDVGYAAYTMDSHNCDRLIVNGMVKNEGNVEVGGFLPFPISYRALVPQRKQVDNLIVPVCLSASHIAFGSIRMEPVFMVLAQSAAIAACLAVDEDIIVQEVDVKKLKQVFEHNPKADGRYADILIHVTDSTQVQLEGEWETGQGRGYGMSFLQSNKEGVNKATFHLSNVIPGKKYKVYTYVPHLLGKDKADQYTIQLFDGNKKDTKTIDLNSIVIQGQTKSTWTEVGELVMQPEARKPYVKISNISTRGVVGANAVLLVPDDDQTI